MKNLTEKQSQVLKRLVGSGRIEADGLGESRTLASLNTRGYAQRTYNPAGGTWEYRPTSEGERVSQNRAED